MPIGLRTISHILLDLWPSASNLTRTMARYDPQNSSIHEKILEHQLVAAITASLWKRGFRDIEVLRSEVDAFGHDLIIETGGVVRHIQLKASWRGAKTTRVNINRRLSLKPSGCVIWFLHDLDTLELGPFRWFGEKPGKPLPDLGDKVARNSRKKSVERPDIRVLPKATFETLESIEELSARLFEPPR